MKIAISINEVLRDTLSQMDYTYTKYLGEGEHTIKKDEITSFNLTEYFDFESKVELNKFLYEEASLEIFGHADQLYENLMTRFNMFLVDIEEDEEHTIELVSREFLKSIPSTLFFLSKLGCRANNIRFVKQNEEEWGDADILITANPLALQNKPEGKISVKINAPYNKNVMGDFELDSILDIIKDNSLREKILNTKIITQKEI
jgi:5'(3')-deoxyribonucleotidase